MYCTISVFNGFRKCDVLNPHVAQVEIILKALLFCEDTCVQ